MQNDPRSHGLWELTAPPAPQTQTLSGPMEADVVVVGGGFTGFSAALHLAERGTKVVLLEGRCVAERRHGGGGVTRLMEARAGDLLGEMALFDGGPRFSSCRTLTPCSVAVFDAAALERLLADDPPLAAALLVSITRRLSLRLRQTGARLFALLAPQ